MSLPSSSSVASLTREADRLLRDGHAAAGEALGQALAAAATEAEAVASVPALWRCARACAGQGLAASARVAAGMAAALLGRHDVIDALTPGQLIEGLLADSQDGDGAWTLRILARLLAAPGDRRFALPFVAGLGDRPLDRLAAQARVAGEPALRDAAALVLAAAQDADGARDAARGAAPGSLGALVEADAARRIAIRQGLAAQARGRVVPRDHPPFIVVHRGAQDHVALCAASLALQNGANNVVLLGDTATAAVGIGRQAALSDHFAGAARLAGAFRHHSVMEPEHGLFSFQRWLVVEEYCRRNRIDQCVIVDSDVLAFSTASDIIAAMPAGFAMNDWTWTTTLRDTHALGAMAAFMHALYARPAAEVAEVAARRGREVPGRTERSFQDMHFFYLFRDNHPAMVFSQYALPFHGGLDQAAGLDNGVETGVPDALARVLPGRPLKRPELRDGRLHFRESAGERRLRRFHTVHCQGPSKLAMHHYAALLLPGAEAAAAGWQRIGEPPRPASAPPPGPPPPLPDLRLREHAALRERVYAALAGLGRLDVRLALRPVAGTRIAPGAAFGVELALRNHGRQDLPATIERHAALACHFELLDAAECRLREVRLPFPPSGLAAGGALALRCAIPMGDLPPGRYGLRADLVHAGVRWFEPDPARRPVLEVEVASGLAQDIGEARAR